MNRRDERRNRKGAVTPVIPSNVDGWQSSQWVKSIRGVTRIFNEHGIQVSHSGLPDPSATRRY